MGSRLYGHFQDFEIREWHEMQPGDVAQPFSDVFSALSFLRRFVHDPLAMAALRKVGGMSLWASSLFKYSDHEVLQQLAWQLVAGRLYLVPLDRPGHGIYGGGGEPAVAPEAPYDDSFEPIAPPEEPVVSTPWITFQVVDDDTATPVAGVKLHLKLPDGTVNTYTTDADGTVHLPDLDPGACDLEHVLDTEAYEVVHFG